MLWVKSYLKLHPKVSVSVHNLDFNGITFSHKDVRFTHCFDFCSHTFHTVSLYTYTQHITQTCSTAYHNNMVKYQPSKNQDEQ